MSFSVLYPFLKMEDDENFDDLIVSLTWAQVYGTKKSAFSLRILTGMSISHAA